MLNQPSNIHDTNQPGVDPQHQVDAQQGSARAVIYLLMIALLVLTQLYLAIPLIPYLVQDFDSHTAAVTLGLASSFSLSYAAGFLIWGPISDHYGRRVVLLSGMLGLIVCTLGCAFAPSLAWLSTIRCLQGLAASSFAPVALAWLNEVFSGQRRATAIGAMATAFLVAGIFGQVLASWLALYWGWRWVFGLTALSLAALMPLLAAQVQETLNTQHRTGVLWHHFVGLLGFALRPATLLLSLAHFSLLLSFVAMYSALGPHLAVFQLEPMAVLWLRLVALPSMGAALLVAPLALRIGMGRLAVLGFVVAACGLWLQAMLWSNLLMLVIGSVVFVAGVALAVPAMISLFAKLAAPKLGIGMAINGFVLFAGASVGPMLAISLSQFSILLFCLTAALLLAAWCVAASTKLAS